MPDPISLALSVVAVLVSAVYGAISHRTARQQNALQERLIALETAREHDRLKQARSAELRGSIERGARSMRESAVVGRAPQYWLVVRNEGTAVARNVRVSLDGSAALKHPLIPRGEDEVTTLGAGAESRYLLAVTLGSARVLDVLIEWEDDSNDPRRWESQLKI